MGATTVTLDNSKSEEVRGDYLDNTQIIYLQNSTS